MPLKPVTSKIAVEWLRRARGNYARACQPKPDEAFWEDLCFDVQQAVEKSVKAVMIQKNIKFSYTHDIGKLFEQLLAAGVNLPLEIANAAALSEYAVETRYPGWGESVTELEFRQALNIATDVLKWADDLIKNP